MSQYDYMQKSLNRRQGQLNRRAEEAPFNLRNKVREEGRKLRRAGIKTHRCRNCGINACVGTELYCTPECQQASKKRMENALAQAEPAIQELFEYKPVYQSLSDEDACWISGDEYCENCYQYHLPGKPC